MTDDIRMRDLLRRGYTWVEVVAIIIQQRKQRKESR